MILFIRKNIFSFFLLLLLLSVCIYYFFLKTKIGYVDSSRLLSGYKSMVEARKELEKKQSVWQGNIDSLAQDVQTAIKTHEKTLAIGSDKEKLLTKEIISSKQKELFDYQNAIKQNASQEEQRLTQSVYSTVNAYLLRYGKLNGYKLILIAANGNIAYADPSLDITDKIVEELNKEYVVGTK
jgi:outer membrane protein